jgi:intracellular sulfur oxidation DsrE/DsrF family protein
MTSLDSRAKRVLALLAVLSVAFALRAAAAPKGAPRVLLLVQQPPQLAAALRTAVELLAGHGFPASEAEIVVCGPAAHSLVKGDKLEPLLAEAHAKGVRLVACGLTLEEKKIDRATLSPSVEVAPNGFVEVLQRKSEGWLTVEL